MIVGSSKLQWALCAFLGCLVSACLISKTPLITESMLPIVAGSLLQSYDVASDGTAKPTVYDKKYVIQRFDIIDGTYRVSQGTETAAAKDQSTLMMSDVPRRDGGETNFWVVMRHDKGEYLYTALLKQKDYYVEYLPAADDFLKYVAASGRQDTDNWQVVDEKDKPKKVVVTSLAFLKEILPQMVKDGYYSMAKAYVPVSSEEAARIAAASPPQPAPEPVEEPPPQPALEQKLTLLEIRDRECKERNNVEACKVLAHNYFYGKDGLKANPLTAMGYYSKACALGDQDGSCSSALAIAFFLEALKPSVSTTSPAAAAGHCEPPRSVFGMEAYARQLVDSQCFGNHKWWCYVDRGGDEAYWCMSRRGELRAMYNLDACAGIEGWCDYDMGY